MARPKTIASHLACAFDRRDEQPNIALAEQLANKSNPDQNEELIDLLTSGTKPQRHDTIKVAYELAIRRPELLHKHTRHFVSLLATNNNRMLWGILAVLDALTDADPAAIIQNLDTILDAADRSSVIAKDKTMSLLAKLNRHDQFATTVTPIILDRLRHTAVNQVPQYAEITAPTIREVDRPAFIKIVENHREAISYPAKKKRLSAVLKTLSLG